MHTLPGEYARTSPGPNIFTNILIEYRGGGGLGWTALEGGGAETDRDGRITPAETADIRRIEKF